MGQWEGGGAMAERGRRGPQEVWTPAEDALIRAAAAANRRPGGYTRDEYATGDRHNGRGYANRLAEVAAKLGRSPAAVRKRAQRIGERSRNR